jgi:hypothetical protein
MSADTSPRSPSPEAGSPVFNAYFVQQLFNWFSRHGSVWSGTPGELLKELNASLPGRPLGYQWWPRDGSQLLAAIYRNSPRISRSGMLVTVVERPGSPRYISLSWLNGVRPTVQPSSNGQERYGPGGALQSGPAPDLPGPTERNSEPGWRNRAQRLAIVFRNLTLPKILNAWLVAFALTLSGVLAGVALHQPRHLASNVPAPPRKAGPSAAPGQHQAVAANPLPAANPLATANPLPRPGATTGLVNVAAPASPSVNPDAALQAAIYDWVESWKNRDLRRHVAAYAPVLDTYFTKHNVSLSQVYKDKEYSFWLYNRVHQYDLRDLRIQWLSPAEAVATFRKTWDFSGRKRFSGDEIEALTLVKTNDGWRIKTERELKVFRRSKG